MASDGSAAAVTDAEFKAAAEDATKLSKKPNNNDLLTLYGLFKQGTEGDCATPKPGMFDFTAMAKWNAWNGHKGKLSKEQAQAKYVDTVKSFKEKYGFATA